MEDGLYIARFRTPLDESSGVIVIQGQAVMGGDGGMYYAGTIDEADQKITVKMTVRQHNETAISVFGDFKSFNLTLTGRKRGREYQFEGRADAAPSMRFTAMLIPAEV